MKSHIRNSGHYLHVLSECIQHDPASVTGWCCLVMKGILSGSDISDKVEMIMSRLDGIDGALVLGAEGDLLVLYRGMQGAGALRLQQLIQEAIGLGDMAEMPTYDLSQNSRLAFDFFRKQSLLLGRDRQENNHRSTEDEKGIRHMAEVLNDTKFGRKYRSPITVMLVEDDPVTLRMVGKLLSQEHVLVTAQNAYEAVVNYLLYAPDLVFLDINLPDESGLKVLDQLTACDPDAYIVMFSGNDGIENIIDSRHRGARGFVAKPFQKDRIRQYLADRQLASELARVDARGSRSS